MLVLVFFHFLLLACGMAANISSGERCEPGTEILLESQRCSCNERGFADFCIPRDSDNKPGEDEKVGEEVVADADRYIEKEALSERCTPGTEILSEHQRCSCNKSGFADLCIPRESANKTDEEEKKGEEVQADVDPSVYIEDEELDKTCDPGAQVRTITKRCVCTENHRFDHCIPIKGQMSIARKARIVGGHDVNIGSNPYMLAIEFSGALQCGATIIASKWAITAAHCFDGGFLPFLYMMKLRGGTSKLQTGGFLFNIVQVVVHERYNESSGDYHYQYDVALIKVHKPFVLMSKTLLPAKLPKSNNRLPVGTMMTILGWGYNKEDGNVSEHLQEVHVPIVGPKECQNALGKDVISPRNMLCAGFPEGNKDACQADSGGPMILNHTLMGIVSFGEGCARENLPGVYTKISAFRDWIDKHIGKLLTFS